MNRKGRVLLTKQMVRKKRILRFRIILGVVFVFSILYGLSHWSKKDSSVVSEFEIVGNHFVMADEVVSAVKEVTSGSYLFLFPRTNKLFLPRQDIKEQLYTKFPALEKVSLSIKDETLMIEVVEFEPVALWCKSTEDEIEPLLEEVIENAISETSDADNENDSGDNGNVDEDEDNENADENSDEFVEDAPTPEDPKIPESFDFAKRRASIDEDCYFVNEFGIVFSLEPELHEYTLLKLHNVINEGPIGSVYVSQEFFSTIVAFEKTLAEKLSIHLRDIYTEDESTYQFVTKEGPSLLVDSTDDYVKVADNLATVMELDAINEAQFGNIEYIDLRFGNRVFYKLR